MGWMAMATFLPKLRTSSGLSSERPVSLCVVLWLELELKLLLEPRLDEEDADVLVVPTVAFPSVSLRYFALSRSLTLQNHLYAQLDRIVPLASA